MARERRASAALRKSALNDPSVHDYGKGKLPPGHLIDGISQLIDADGEVKLQWIKSKRERGAQLQELVDAMEECFTKYEGLVAPTPAPKDCDIDDRLVVVPIGDPHHGLHVWGEETGSDNFNLKISFENTMAAIGELFSVVPKTKQCLIINLGDYFHGEVGDKTTKGTAVDMDGRRAKVLESGIDLFMAMIDTALTHHEIVNVICCQGNHDGDSSLVLRIALSKIYSKEPRVRIDKAPTKFHRFRFGKTLIGTTHGDTAKDSDLGMIMALDWKDDWAECDSFHWYKGHVHHDSLKEYHGGVIVETFRTLAPRDAWHSAAGYRSGRDIKADVWHIEDGHEQRYIVGIKKVKRLVNE
jgi:hypothetical protein